MRELGEISETGERGREGKENMIRDKKGRGD